MAAAARPSLAAVNAVAAPLPMPPAAAWERLVPADVDLVAGWRHPAATAVWTAVVWGRLGRGDLAVAHLDTVDEPTLAPWVAAERGRILRELGLHAHAEACEAPALAAAVDPVDAVMLTTSLAADAIGRGELGLAERRLREAEVAAVGLTGPRAARQRLRRSWVATELALYGGGEVPPDALARLPRWDDDHDAPTTVPDLDAGSAFHRAKAWLFAGVVRDDRRLLEAARDQAPPILAWAVALARQDRGIPGAEQEARDAWAAVVPPSEHADEVAATPVGRRLGDGPAM